MTYTVIFTQYHTYEVEAKDDYEAENKAYERFRNDMCNPVAHTWYDEVDVECDEDEDTVECDGRCLNCDHYDTDDCPDRK